MVVVVRRRRWHREGVGKGCLFKATPSGFIGRKGSTTQYRHNLSTVFE